MPGEVSAGRPVFATGVAGGKGLPLFASTFSAWCWAPESALNAFRNSRNEPSAGGELPAGRPLGPSTAVFARPAGAASLPAGTGSMGNELDSDIGIFNHE